MIVVDTSALMAILLDEPDAEACAAALESAEDPLLSAGTMAEALIVAARRNIGAEMARLIDGMPFETVAVTSASARRIALAYQTWGKGRHGAALNFGDCFAYDLAKTLGCPLLYVGRDFGQTDVDGVL